jgi:hypothetical protein
MPFFDKIAIAKEILAVRDLLAFVPEGDFQNKREMGSIARRVRLVIRTKLEDIQEQAEVINTIGELARGRGKIRDINPVVLREFNNFKGWGAGDFDALYSALRHPLVNASVDNVITRIQNTQLAPSDKSEMLRHPNDLSLAESGRLYRRVDFNKTEMLDGGRRRCQTDWKNHAKYRAELRGVNPNEMSQEVCDFIDEKNFVDRSPLDGAPKPENNVRMKLPEGVAVVNYDPRKDPVPAEVITTWASINERIAGISERIVANGAMEKALEDTLEEIFSEQQFDQNPKEAEVDYYAEPAQDGGRDDPSWDAYVDSVYVREKIEFSVELKNIYDRREGDVPREVVVEFLKSWKPKEYKVAIETERGTFEFKGDMDKMRIVGDRVIFTGDYFDATDRGVQSFEKMLRD